MTADIDDVQTTRWRQNGIKELNNWGNWLKLIGPVGASAVPPSPMFRDYQPKHRETRSMPAVNVDHAELTEKTIKIVIRDQPAVDVLVCYYDASLSCSGNLLAAHTRWRELYTPKTLKGEEFDKHVKSLPGATKFKQHLRNYEGLVGMCFDWEIRGVMKLSLIEALHTEVKPDAGQVNTII